MGSSITTQTNRVIRPDEVHEEVPESFGIVKIERKHFSEGSCRLAFRGKLIKTGEGQGTMRTIERKVFVGWKSIFNRNAREEYYPCVVKVFKREAPAMRRQNWREDVQNLILTKEFADKFNEIGPGATANKKIKVATPLLARIERLGESSFLFFSWFNDERQVGEWVLVEPFLEGKFEKFNSNNGWVNTDANAKLAIAFSHYTWHESNGEYCITDMQGLRGKEHGSYILSDPAVQSREAGTYGPTDLGFDGVRAFFQTHICNEFCLNLRKPKLAQLCNSKSLSSTTSTSGNWRNQRKSSYVWEVPGLAAKMPVAKPAGLKHNIKDSIEVLHAKRRRRNADREMTSAKRAKE